MSTDAPEPGLYGFAKHPRRAGRLTVDPVRDAERRGVMAALDVLTSRREDDPPGVLTFNLPDGSLLDGTIIMKQIGLRLASMRPTATLIPGDGPHAEQIARIQREKDTSMSDEDKSTALSAPDIVAFLEARLDEAEAVIGNTTQGPWKMWGIRLLADQDGTSNIETAVPVADVYSPPQHERMRTWNVTHIQNYQPLIVQKQIDAYRRIIESYKRLGATIKPGVSDIGHITQYVTLGEVLIDLAAQWSDHPDWHEDWAVE